MREERLELVKKETRSVVITYPKGVSLQHFLKAYKELIGVRLPTREFGYISDIDFLNSLSDVVRIQVDKNGDYLLNCIVDETTEHIKSLVVRQRDPKARRSKNNNNSKNSNFKSTNNVFKNKPFISASLRENLFKVLVDFPEGIDYHSLLLAYRKIFKRPLNLEFLSDNNREKLEKLAIAVSELEVQVIEDTTKLFYKPLVNTNNKNVIDTAKDSNIEESVEEKPCPTPTKVVTISAVPQVVKNHFEKVMKLYPDGVLAKHFPLLYEKISKQPFDMLDLGYNSFLDLAGALPDVFIAVKCFENPNDWKLFHPCFSEKANQLRDKNKQLEISKLNQKNVEVKKMPVPADIASPTLSYSPPQLPNDINLSAYIPVFISVTINPSCFWFKLHTKKVVDRFREFEEDLQCFYDSAAADSLIMVHKDINIGSTCVVYANDNWYRVTVTSSPVDNLVNVYFVDFGGWEKVQCSNLRYLKYSFITLPSQAFKAKLACVKPTKGVKIWSRRADLRFSQLTIKPNIMAKVHLEFDEILSVFLCDTSGQDDIHIDKTLIDEGLAERCLDDELQAEISDNSDVNDAQDLVSHHISRRVISEKSFLQKLVLGDGYEVHLISIYDQVYVSAADIRFLFWPDKPDEVVKLRLEFKNILIPTTVVSNREYPDLFQKCENCSVRGFQNQSNQQYSVVLYLLTDVMKILNALGHSSILIRETIKKALTIFNSGSEEKWVILKQLSDMMSICENISTNNNNKDDYDTYCLYDLKALYEALKCEKMRLEKICSQNSSDSNIKETKKTELFASKIKEKIEFVQAVCSAYS